MNNKNYILKDGNIILEPDSIKWVKWFWESKERNIGNTKIGDTRISTVFLGIDHRFTGDGVPILFETMIFGGEHDQYQRRYSSLKSAKKGHAKAIELAGLKVIEGIEKWK